MNEIYFNSSQLVSQVFGTTVVLLVRLFSVSFHFTLYFADQPNERFIRRPAGYVRELMFNILIVRNTLKICKFVLTVRDLFFLRSHNSGFGGLEVECWPLVPNSEMIPTRCNNCVYSSQWPLRRINAIVASCWNHFTIKHDARNHKY